MLESAANVLNDLELVRFLRVESAPRVRAGKFDCNWARIQAFANAGGGSQSCRFPLLVNQVKE